MNEQSNNVLAEEFRFFMTWGKYRDKLGLSISKHEDVRLAVDKAYIDMSTRTIKGLSLEFKGNEALKNACKDGKWEEIKNKLIDDCKIKTTPVKKQPTRILKLIIYILKMNQKEKSLKI